MDRPTSRRPASHMPASPSRRRDRHRRGVPVDQTSPLTFAGPLAVGIAALVSAVILSACGSSGSSTTAGRADFVARANAICASGLRKAEGLTTPKSTAEVLPFAQHASSIVTGLLIQLKGVTPPASSRAAYARFLQTAGAEASEIGQLVAALRTRDVAHAKTALAQLSSNTSNAQARALGLSECARTRTPSP
ncbi:MAG: hypothetical protein JWL67_3 [Solirubrobacterales bacterium]|nr:hypothetical protein [Solirubrobacterales bacterium]